MPIYSHRSGITIPTPKERKKSTPHRRSQAVRNLEQSLSEKPATVSKVPDSCESGPEQEAPQTSFTSFLSLMRPVIPKGTTSVVSDTESDDLIIIRKKKKCQRIDSSAESDGGKEEEIEQKDTSIRFSPRKRKKPKTTTPEDHKSKYHCCVFCGELFANVPRHMRAFHDDETEVRDILLINNKTSEGKRTVRNKWGILVNKGDFQHNQNVKKTGSGTCIVKYRNQKIKEMGHCPYCFAMYSSAELWRHKKSCTAYIEKKDTEEKSMLKESRRLGYSCVTENEYVQKLLSAMKQDCEVDIVRSEPLLVKWAERMVESIDKKQFSSRKRVVSQKLRQMGRFVRKCREKSEIKSLQECFVPRNFDTVLRVVKLCGEQDEYGEYASPSVVQRLSTYLKHVAQLAKSQAIKEGDENMQKNVDQFLQLHENELCVLTCNAKVTLDERHYNKTEILPVFEDINIVSEYIDKEIKNWMAKSGDDAYVNLVKLNLSKIILFNRKRCGEAEKMTMENYNKGISNPQTKPHADVLDRLSNLEKVLLTTLTRIEIRGKRNRRVPILLSPSMLAGLQRMVELREGRVSEDSRYLFARIGMCQTPYRGHICLNEIATRAGVSDPNVFKSTKLRKHLATMSQMLEISQSDRQLLANFMGHSDEVHGKYYKLPDTVLDRCKVAQVLIALNSGRADYRGRSLEEIQTSNVMLEDLGAQETNVESDTSESAAEEPVEAEEQTQEEEQQIPRTRKKSKTTRSQMKKRRRRKETGSYNFLHVTEDWKKITLS